MDKQNVTYIQNRIFSALKRKEILIGYNTGKLEGIMLNEIRQSQKDKNCMIPSSLRQHI